MPTGETPDPTLGALFVTRFEELGIDYYATGGYAAILYGEPRLTTDIDVVASLTPRDARRLHAAFDPDEFYAPPPEVMIEEAGRPRHGRFNIIHAASGLRADVYVAGDSDLEAWAMANRRRLEGDAGAVWVSPPEYVIAHKLTYRRDGGSDRHVRDVRAMLAVSGASLDRALLADLVDRMGVRAQWHEVVGDAPTLGA